MDEFTQPFVGLYSYLFQPMDGLDLIGDCDESLQLLSHILRR